MKISKVMDRIEEYLLEQTEPKTTTDVTIAIGYKADQSSWVLHCLKCLATYGEVIMRKNNIPNGFQYTWEWIK